MKKIKGMSLLEILVVVSIFAVLGILVTQSVILTVRGSKKSETLVNVRENLNYAMGIVERQIRNSNSITDCASQPSTSRIDYLDQNGVAAYFSCPSGGGYIASGSGRLTSTDIDVTTCSFVCTPGTAGNPDSVNIDFVAKDVNTTGIETSTVSISNQVYLRNY